MKYVLALGLSFLLLMSLAETVRADDAPSRADGSFTEQYPKLQKYTFTEPPSGIRIGFGLSPFGIMRNQISFAANLFQVHWTNSWLDWEMFSVSFAMTVGGDDVSKSRDFVFRTVPKYRINSTFSIGPLLGYEFVSFPDLQSQIFNGSLATPQESFSSRGFVYGGVLSEEFPVSDKLTLKINQTVYQQTYSTTNAPENGWVYKYDNSSLNHNQGPINPGTVFLLEFSILY